MFYVGLDVHVKSIVACVSNEDGKVVERLTIRGRTELEKFLVRLPKFHVCFEASCGYGPLHDLLRRDAARVVVAHPGKLSLIYKSTRKNDRHDAENLAKLLYLNMLPTVHVPPSNVRAWRELINFRHSVVQKRTKVKLQLRALLRGAGIPDVPRSLWTQRGQHWLKQVAFPEPTQTLHRDLLVSELESLTDKLHRVERELNRIAGDHPGVAVLRSIPGVGVRTAEALVAFLDAPHRFRNAKSIGAYFGLVPRQDQSGAVNRLGHITRQGPGVVRGLLTEAAWQAIRRSPTVRAFYERVRRGERDRQKIAIVATAHYLARVTWAMLRDGSLWTEHVSPANLRSGSAKGTVPSASPSPRPQRRVKAEATVRRKGLAEPHSIK